MRWVKLSLPPLVRCRWLLAILRLTSNSLAGTGRTLVAVGTARLAAMFLTMAAPAPRIGSPAGACGDAAPASAPRLRLTSAAAGAATPSCLGAAAGLGAGVGVGVAAGAELVGDEPLVLVAVL